MKTGHLWKRALKGCPADAPPDRIETTAQILEGITYEPVLLLQTPGFLRMGHKGLEAEIARIQALTDQEMRSAGFTKDANLSEFKAKHIQLLIYHYSLLCRLRVNDPSAWDVINELYEDD